MKRRVIIFVSMLACGTACWLGFTSTNNDTAVPVPAPSGMTITLTNVSALDYSDACEYPAHEYKVTFYGSRYSDGQEAWDPSSPFYGSPWYFSNPIFCLCFNFYYCSGIVSVYTRPTSTSQWEYQGCMQLSESNCTMEGSKVTYCTINCQYLMAP
jgi:hypothetical protein